MKQFQESIVKLSQDESTHSQYRRWFKEQGILFTEVDKEQSTQLAHDLKTIPKECFTNCGKAVLYDFQNRYRYFEGYVNVIGIPIEHAFLVDKDNKVVDITMGIDPKIKVKNAIEKYGVDLKLEENEFGVEYFGVEIPRKNLFKLLTDERVSHTPMIFLYWEKLK